MNLAGLLLLPVGVLPATCPDISAETLKINTALGAEVHRGRITCNVMLQTRAETYNWQPWKNFVQAVHRDCDNVLFYQDMLELNNNCLRGEMPEEAIKSTAMEKPENKKEALAIAIILMVIVLTAAIFYVVI